MQRSPVPAAHRLAAQPTIHLWQLSGIPLRLAPRQDNPAFHDLVLGACAEAGFEPLPGPSFTTAQDTLAEIGAGPPAWTVLYAAAAGLMPVYRVALRPLAGLTAQTCLAVPPAQPCGTCSTPAHRPAPAMTDRRRARPSRWVAAVASRIRVRL